MSPAYDAGRDYSTYPVTDEDRPLLSLRQAAFKLDRTSETVRKLVVNGRLPSRRRRSGHNPPYEVPLWAIEGWSERTRNQLDVFSASGAGSKRSALVTDAEARQEKRIRALEDALAALRAAREHEEAARSLQAQAMVELASANDILANSVSSILVADVLDQSG